MSISHDAKKVRIGLNFNSPKSLVDSLEKFLGAVDAKSAIAVMTKVSATATAGAVVARYYALRCTEALLDGSGSLHGAEPKIQAFLLALLADGITATDRPEIDDQSKVKLPESFFSRYPEAKITKREFEQFCIDTATDRSYLFSLAGKVDRFAGLAKRVYFGQQSPGLFDYWAVDFGIRASQDDQLIELDKEGIASHLMDDILAKHFPKNFRRRTRSSIVSAFGSCFALNLANSLREKNIDCQSFRIEESINTTLANRLLLEYVLLGKESGTSFFSGSTKAADVARIRNALGRSDMIVLTVGVSPIIEWKDTGNICIATEGYKHLFDKGVVKYRFTTVEENKDNLVAIVNLLREHNPGVEIFLSLSPVPLVGIADGSSVIMDDVLSKSTLRLAINEASKECDFIYWPSFEVVKWIAPHISNKIGYQAYGHDDRNSRHVSKWLIDIITSKFVSYAFEK
jgi:hypothetical protein